MNTRTIIVVAILLMAFAALSVHGVFAGPLFINDTVSGIGENESITATHEYIGYYATGQFTQSGGTNTVSEDLSIGFDLDVTPWLIGYYDPRPRQNATGTYIQSGGSLTVGKHFLITETSRYELSGGSLEINGHARIDGILDFGSGNATMNAGDSGLFDFSRGSIVNATGASFSAGPNTLTIFPTGFNPDVEIGSFTSQGMVHTAGSTLVVGPDQGFSGAGWIDDRMECAGRVNGDFFLRLNDGINLYGNGNVTLGNGGLNVNDIHSGISDNANLRLSMFYIGNSSTGTFTQSGGNLHVTNYTYLGYEAGSQGTLTITGGNSYFRGLTVGYRDKGTLNIADANSRIEIGTDIRFGAEGNLIAVPGSVIHMVGSSFGCTFTNESTDPSALAGLSNLTMVFEGGSAKINPFEVAGKDVGDDFSGFLSNFAIDTLILGGDNIGQVCLVDNIDNQPGSVGQEALYVENLVLGVGSYLDLNGINIYYCNLTDLGGIVELNGGSLNQVTVPEPSTLSILLILGGMILLWKNSNHKSRHVSMSC